MGILRKILTNWQNIKNTKLNGGWLIYVTEVIKEVSISIIYLVSNFRTHKAFITNRRSYTIEALDMQIHCQ